VDARHAPCLDLELVCGGTRSSRYRQRPSDPPWERLRTRRWGQLFSTPLDYLKLFTCQFEAIATFHQRKDSIFLPELKIRERPPSTLRNVNDGPLAGAGVEGPGASTINAKKRQRRGPGRFWERPPSMLRNVDGGPPGGARAEDPRALIGAPGRCRS
jgi:hypothetical protein